MVANAYSPLSLGAAVIYAGSQDKYISVEMEGINISFETESNTLREALNQKGIQYKTSDLIDPDIDSVLSVGITEVTIVHSMPVMITDEDKVIYGESPYTGVDDILKDLSVNLYAEDIVRVANPLDELFTGIKIYIDRASTIMLQVDGEIREVHTRALTVSELLKREGIVMGEKDRVDPPQHTSLSNEMNVNVIRVSESEDTDIVEIPFSVRYKDDANLPKGEIRIEQDGKSGKKEVQFKKIIENGKEVARETISEKILEEPIEQIIIRGTKTYATGAFSDWINDATRKYGVDAGKMSRVMYCESSGNPNSVGGGGRFHGLFQYLKSTWAGASSQAGWGGASIYDPKAQIYTTAWKISIQGYGAWPVCGYR